MYFMPFRAGARLIYLYTLYLIQLFKSFKSTARKKKQITYYKKHVGLITITIWKTNDMNACSFLVKCRIPFDQNSHL